MSFGPFRLTRPLPFILLLEYEAPDRRGTAAAGARRGDAAPRLRARRRDRAARDARVDADRLLLDLLRARQAREARTRHGEETGGGQGRRESPEGVFRHAGGAPGAGDADARRVARRATTLLVGPVGDDQLARAEARAGSGGLAGAGQID